MGENVKAAPIMKIRRRRGGLDESMATMKEIPATLAAVVDYLKETSTLGSSEYSVESVTVKPAAYPRADDRIGWAQTLYVMARDHTGNYVVAYCDQAVSS